MGLIEQRIKRGFWADWNKVIDWEKIDKDTWEKIYAGDRVVVKSIDGRDVLLSIKCIFDAQFLNTQ